MGDINIYYVNEAFLKARTEFITEKHRHPDCYYEHRLNWYIVGTNIGIKVLIRVCVCGLQTHRGKFLSRNEIYFAELGDGIEFHFDDRCRFDEPTEINGNRQFRKVCYCHRPQLSYMRWLKRKLCMFSFENICFYSSLYMYWLISAILKYLKDIFDYGGNSP